MEKAWKKFREWVIATVLLIGVGITIGSSFGAIALGYNLIAGLGR
jgi:hypothetical protein